MIRWASSAGAYASPAVPAKAWTCGSCWPGRRAWPPARSRQAGRQAGRQCRQAVQCSAGHGHGPPAARAAGGQQARAAAQRALHCKRAGASSELGAGGWRPGGGHPTNIQAFQQDAWHCVDPTALPCRRAPRPRRCPGRRAGAQQAGVQGARGPSRRRVRKPGGECRQVRRQVGGSARRQLQLLLQLLLERLWAALTPRVPTIASLPLERTGGWGLPGHRNELIEAGRERPTGTRHQPHCDPGVPPPPASPPPRAPHARTARPRQGCSSNRMTQ
jgi:hypothetical protein